MAVTNAQIRAILLANPNISDEKLAKAMDNYGVTPAQLQGVLASMGSSVTPQKVQERYEAAGGTTYSLATLNSQAEQDALSGFTSEEQARATGLVSGDVNEQPTILKYLYAFKDTGGKNPWDTIASGGNIPQGMVAIANAPWIPTLVGMVRKNYGEEAASDLENWVLAIKAREAGTLENNPNLLEKIKNSKIKVGWSEDIEGNKTPTASINWSAVNEGVGSIIDIVKGIATGNVLDVFKGVKQVFKDKTNTSYEAQKEDLDKLSESFARWAEDNPNIREWVAAPTWSEQAEYNVPGGPTEYTDIGDEIFNVPGEMLEGTYTDDDGNVWAYDVLGRRGIIEKAEVVTVESDSSLTDGGDSAASELEREQAVTAVNDWLAKNPTATAEDIQARLDAYAEQGIDAEGIFTEATGADNVNDYVTGRDAATSDGGTDSGTDGGTDTEIDPERPWIFENGVFRNVITGETVTPSDPSLYTEGEYYSGPSSTEMNPEEVKYKAINDWLVLHPNATVEQIRTAMKNNKVTDEEFVTATGKTPEELGKTTTSTDDGDTGGGTDTQCAEGFHWDEASQSCVPNKVDDSVDKSCPIGSHWDEASQSCVPNKVDDSVDKSCPIGSHWDEVTQSCVPNKVDDSVDKSCPIGSHWDEVTQSCVPNKVDDSGGGDDGGTDTQCGVGYHWDEATQSCVKDSTGGDDGGGDGGGGTDTQCGVGYHWDEASQSCVKDSTGTGDGGGNGDGNGNGLGGGLLFGMATGSPTRTTDEILAPDLFKLDTNIPLLSKLTQYSPMAAPQYLLSGISQRYKV